MLRAGAYIQDTQFTLQQRYSKNVHPAGKGMTVSHNKAVLVIAWVSQPQEVIKNPEQLARSIKELMRSRLYKQTPRNVELQMVCEMG